MLVNLTTNLKSLGWGKDKIGGGDSGLPYIKTGFPEDSPDGEYLAGLFRNNFDFLVRGGTNSIDTNFSGLSIISAETDGVRIRRYLVDNPLFTSKQILLQKSNPKIETGGLTLNLLNTQTYNLNKNLLDQVVNQGSGIHIPRAGSTSAELGAENPQNKYEYIVSHKQAQENRLVTLYNYKIIPEEIKSPLSSNAAVKLGLISTPGEFSDTNILLDYVGGPDSLYGDGNTTINRIVDTIESYNTYNIGGFSNSNYDPDFTQIPLLSSGINYKYALGVTNAAKSAGIKGLVRKKFIAPSLPESKGIDFTFNPSFKKETDPNFEKFREKSKFEKRNERREKRLEEGRQKLNETFDNFKALAPKPSTEDIEDFTDNGFGGLTPKSLHQQGYGVTSGDFIRPEASPNGISKINYMGNTMGYSNLLASKTNLELGYILQDFRTKTDKNNEALALSTNYTVGGPNNAGFNIENRIGVGSPGKRTSGERNGFYEKTLLNTQDRINLTPIYRKSVGEPVENDSKNGDVRDLIKFCIETIDKDNSFKSLRLHFRAYITNFSDNIAAEWDAKRYMGRGENFYTYQGFTRDVGFTFIVAPQSVQEMEKVYQKVNYLASTLHPSYQTGTGFMKGSIHKLTLGEYFYRTSGVITSMNISVENDYPWEIKMKQPEIAAEIEAENKKEEERYKREIGNIINPVFDRSLALPNPNATITPPKLNKKTINPEDDDRGQMEVPQILKIQMTFKPIMDKLPQRGLKEPVIINEKTAFNYLIRKDFLLNVEEINNQDVVAVENSITPTGLVPNISSQISVTGLSTTTAPITNATNDINNSATTAAASISITGSIATDASTAPQNATATSTQPAPADSWVNGEVVPNFSSVISNTSNPASPQTWTVTVQKTGPGFYQWVILEPDGNTVSSAANAYTTPQTALTDGKAEAENISGYNTPIQNTFNNAFGG